MNALLPSTGYHRPGRDDQHVRQTWACLASWPLFLVLAFVVGSGLGTALGLTSGDVASPSAAVVVILVMIGLFAIPTGLAWLFASRALARGDARARVPALVVSVLSVAFIAVNALSWAGGLVLG